MHLFHFNFTTSIAMSNISTKSTKCIVEFLDAIEHHPSMACLTRLSGYIPVTGESLTLQGCTGLLTCTVVSDAAKYTCNTLGYAIEAACVCMRCPVTQIKACFSRCYTSIFGETVTEIRHYGSGVNNNNASGSNSSSAPKQLTERQVYLLDKVQKSNSSTAGATAGTSASKQQKRVNPSRLIPTNTHNTNNNNNNNNNNNSTHNSNNEEDDVEAGRSDDVSQSLLHPLGLGTAARGGYKPVNKADDMF